MSTQAQGFEARYRTGAKLVYYSINGVKQQPSKKPRKGKGERARQRAQWSRNV